MKLDRLILCATACAVAFAGAATPAAAAGTDKKLARGVYRGVTSAAHFDVSPPLRAIPPLPIRPEKHTDLEDRPTGLEGPPGVEDFDPIVQSQIGADGPDMPSPGVSFDGPSNLAGVSPPDSVGDVGPNHYVAMSNLYFAIYSKTGTLLYGPVATNTLWSGFGGPCQTENAGDPVVLHDQLSDRWILTQFTAAGPTYYNCVAVSTTADPTGSYYRYAFSTGSNFPDYPKYGVWPDALYISTREFAGGSTFAGVGAYAVNRAQLVAGNPSPQVISFLVAPGSTAYNIGDGLLPADLDGSTLPPAGAPNFFMGSMDNGGAYAAPQDALTLWKFTANFSNPPASSFVLTNTLAVTAVDTVFPCSGRSCIAQPGTTNKLDHLGYRQRPLHRLAYRNYGTYQSLVTNQSVEATTNISGIRWYEVRDPNGTPVIYQQGTYAPGASDGIQRWMGSVAMDGAGNMALGYSASDGTSVYPGLRYTGRLVGDALGSMPQGEGTIVNGTGSQTGSQRWGDYTSLNVDPNDDCTFWYVNEYVPTTSSTGWRLRIGSFKFPSCGGPATPDFSLGVSPASLNLVQGSNGSATVTVTSINSFSSAVSLSASGLPAGVTASFSVNPVTPPANGSANSTLTLTVSGSAATGTFPITITGVSGALSHSAALSLTVTSAGSLTAVYDATLKAPKCATVGVSCDSGASLLLGRDGKGPEPNQPNTINASCADGTSGTFHSDESNDRLKVLTTDGSNFAAGKTVRIEATVWAWSTGSSDKLDLYYAANANSPSWVFIATLTPPAGGAQVLSATYTLPAGTLQAVRAQFRYSGSAGTCTTGSYNDRDDLIFAVQ